MTFLDFIGFLIAMVAFFFLIWQQARQVKRLREHPEEYQEDSQDQEERLREMLSELGVEAEALPGQKPPPVPKSLQKPAAVIEEAVEKVEVPVSKKHSQVFYHEYERPKSALHGFSLPPHDPYRRHGGQKTRFDKALEKGVSLQDAIVLREVLGPPRGW